MVAGVLTVCVGMVVVVVGVLAACVGVVTGIAASPNGSGRAGMTDDWLSSLSVSESSVDTIALFQFVGAVCAPRVRCGL